MKPHTLLFAAILVGGLTSCETTGDPSQGGLFGWSQSKANDRLYERQRTLAEIEQDNQYQAQRQSSLEAERRRLEAQRR